MDLSFFIKGLIFGFSIAAPVGPIGILCIRRSLTSGWTAGLLTGMGAATADAIYGCVAGFGLAGITGFVVGQQAWIQLSGGLFLCWLGIRIFLSRTDERLPATTPGNAAMDYLSALFLTLTNPMTILSFAAVFAGMGLSSVDAGHAAAGWLVAGVFSGSMAWWIILSSASSLFNTRMNTKTMRWINRICGAVITAFGLVVVIG
ncbi:LysE family transporter [uncultured Desulfosarcina sp.]|uniref:LysE family translocator n=1 Tax=uncultured Desulfosarcina sp. TaxID=218289 RepID=UPI0029C7F497|nr:LysE family transporter [uncultured Desulfosarcina sp.]